MSHLLIDEPPLQVLPSLAERIGLNEAILLQQLHYWLQVSENTQLDQDGQKRRWVWKTLDGWSKEFPFWSQRTIQRVLRSLVDDGIIVAEQKRKDEGDMTTFYAIRYEALPNTTDCPDACGQDDQVGTTDCPHGDDRLSNSAPAHNASAPSETTTENTTENTTAASAGAPPHAREDAPDPFTVKENDVDAITEEAFGTPIQGLSIKDQIEQICEENAPEAWDCLRAVCQTIIDEGWNPSAALVKTRLQQQIQMINETHDEEQQDDFAEKARSIFEAAGRGAGVHG